jgi:hypothetical protein
MEDPLTEKASPVNSEALSYTDSGVFYGCETGFSSNISRS